MKKQIKKTLIEMLGMAVENFYDDPIEVVFDGTWKIQDVAATQVKLFTYYSELVAVAKFIGIDFDKIVKDHTSVHQQRKIEQVLKTGRLQ